MTPEHIHELFTRLRQAWPNPTTELQHSDAYTLLVAVVLSANATDRSVNKATAELFQVANTPEQMLALGEERLRDYLKGVNHYRNKARYLIQLSEILVREHGGQVPADRAALEALPGVGRKTASVVLNTAFGHHEIAVDTHIFRVCNRTGLAPGRTPREVEDGLQRVTPPEFKRDAHHLLILHGRYVCRARRPDCPVCPIVDLCAYEAKTAPV